MYFYTVFEGKPVLTEVQINTESCMSVKKDETELYDQIKNLLQNPYFLGPEEVVYNIDLKDLPLDIQVHVACRMDKILK